EGDHPGVDRVGLGQNAGRLGKQPDTRRVEQLDDKAFGLQCLDDLVFVATTGFQSDLCNVGGTQPSSQPDQAAMVAADAQDKIARQEVNVELVLADVDAGDCYSAVHLRDPFLACGLLTVQPYGRCEETMRAPRSTAVSANAATGGPYGLRTVGAGGGCFLLPRQRPFRRIPHNMQGTFSQRATANRGEELPLLRASRSGRDDGGSAPVSQFGFRANIGPGLLRSRP